MSAPTACTSRDSLVESIQSLLVDVKHLPENIFDDTQGRQALQHRIGRLKNDVQTPFERLFGELCFQVGILLTRHRAFTLKVTQPHQSAAVRVALEGKWFEVLADGCPKTAQDIAAATGAERALIGTVPATRAELQADSFAKCAS